MKIRKISNCKSRRLESKILELLSQNLCISTISKKMKLSSTTIKKIATANGIITDDRVAAGKLRQKAERNESVHKMLLEDKTYEEISKIMSVSKQRISQIAKTYNFRRHNETRKKHETIINNIKNDIKLEIPYKEMVSKYNITKHYSKLRYWGLPTGTYSSYVKNRNEKIGLKYKSGKKAKEIINLNDEKLKNPSLIETENQIYHICAKQGIYRYPQIKNRSLGEISESTRILKTIIRLKDKKKLSFEKIALYLNKKKYKTISGKPFASPNTRCKYIAAKRRNL